MKKCCPQCHREVPEFHLYDTVRDRSDRISYVVRIEEGLEGDHVHCYVPVENMVINFSWYELTIIRRLGQQECFT